MSFLPGVFFFFFVLVFQHNSQSLQKNTQIRTDCVKGIEMKMKTNVCQIQIEHVVDEQQQQRKKTRRMKTTI